MVECETDMVIDGDRYYISGELDGDEWVDIKLDWYKRSCIDSSHKDIIDANIEQISEALHEQYRNNLGEASEYRL